MAAEGEIERLQRSGAGGGGGGDGMDEHEAHELRRAERGVLPRVALDQHVEVARGEERPAEGVAQPGARGAPRRADERLRRRLGDELLADVRLFRVPALARRRDGEAPPQIAIASRVWR